MASISAVLEAQHVIPYTFRNLSLLQRALRAGDSNSDDREGNRGMAQVGDNLMSLVITSEGFDKGISRKEVQATITRFASKSMCSMLARSNRLDQMVVFSERQQAIGPQPTILKNVLAAIVAAVWFDSQRDYGSIVRVMASLGLINYLESANSPQNDSATPPSSANSVNSDHGPGEANATTADVDFDAFLDTDMLGPECYSINYNAEIADDWLAMDSQKCLTLAPQSGQSSTDGQAAVVVPEWQLGLEIMTATAGFSMLHNNDILEQATGTDGGMPMPNEAAATDVAGTDEAVANDAVGQCSPSASQTSKKRKAGAGSSGSKDSRAEGLSSKLGGPVRLVFKAYNTHERQKFEQQPEVFNQYYGHMFEYQQELSSIRTGHLKTLANMALTVGDGAAMLVLKQAIESARSCPAGEPFHVGKIMSPEQRVKAINALDLLMAHFRLARWLHIYKLYEELSAEIGGTDADGFVVMTNADLDLWTNEARTLAQRGNPRNLERASITKRMMDHSSIVNTAQKNQKNMVGRMKRLRRVGQRLQLLVNRWGIGVLSLLGPTWTEDVIMKTTDDVFAQFLDVVDRFEGHNIRTVSEAAELGVQLFLNDSTAVPILLIEVVEEDVLQQLPRLSQDMRALFSPAYQG